MSKAERLSLGSPVWEIKAPDTEAGEDLVRLYVRDDLTYDEARELQKAITEEMER